MSWLLISDFKIQAFGYINNAPLSSSLHHIQVLELIMSEGVKINPVSPRTFELLEMETIESQFPVVFDDGGGFPMFTAYCAQCNRPLENQHLRGLVTRWRRDVYTIEAAGACFACKIATPLSFRLHQDGTMTGISLDSGKWTRWDKKPGFFRGIFRALFQGRF